jgi:uncharacterized protein
MSFPDYQELETALGGGQDGTATAEAHGTLCGLLSAGAEDMPDAWIQNTLADTEDYSFGGRGDAATLLETLHIATVAALADDDMAFHLLLPADEVSLEARAAALGAWCSGFLYGLAARGLRPTEALPEELREILADFAEIGRAGVAEEEAEEAGEQAFVELVEYVRVAVQIVHHECQAPGYDSII